MLDYIWLITCNIFYWLNITWSQIICQNRIFQHKILLILARIINFDRSINRSMYNHFWSSPTYGARALTRTNQWSSMIGSIKFPNVNQIKKCRSKLSKKGKIHMIISAPSIIYWTIILAKSDDQLVWSSDWPKKCVECFLRNWPARLFNPSGLSILKR